VGRPSGKEAFLVFGILHRAIFTELAKVFLLSLAGITGIVVMASVVQELSQHGFGPVQILMAIPLIVPSMMPFIIPPTTLFASCVVYGRLAHDNEIVAIKAAGINVIHVVWPGIALGLIMSLTTLGLYLDLIPSTHRILRTAVVNDVEEFLYSMLRRDREIGARADLKLPYEMYVKQVQGRRLKGAIFMRKNPPGKSGYDVIASAREAEMTVNLSNNEVVVRMWNGNFLSDNSGDRARFGDKEWTVELKDLQHSGPVSWRDMTWRGLLEARAEAEKEVENQTIQAGLRMAGDNLVNPPVNLSQAVEAHKFELKHGALAKLNGLSTEIQMRPALSFGCLFFVLVGCPVGIWFSRSDYLSAFITCFLPIVFIYYPLQLCSTNLAKDGKLDAALALWLANGAMGVIAVFLFGRLVKN
jgi:lipopolysaccharide export system permease protein